MAHNRWKDLEGASTRNGLTACDTEPVHLVPLIQEGMGTVLVVHVTGEDKSTRTVRQVSANCKEWFNKSPDEMLEHDLDDVMPKEVCALVDEAINFEHLPIECSTDLPERFKEQVLGQDMCDWWKDIYSINDMNVFLKSNSTVPPLASRDMTSRLILETKGQVHVSVSASRRPQPNDDDLNETFMPVWSVLITFEEADVNTETFMSEFGAVERLDRQNWQLESARDEKELAQLLTDCVADFCQFDRVMYINFLPGGHCETVAEKCKEGIPSFLNYRFPATDIPIQARTLLKRNRVRHIMDTTSPGVELVPCHIDGRLTDLSNCHLRQCGPIHRQYLNNMKVFSSCTAAVMVNDMIVGMLSCHNNACPLTMGPAKRMLLRQLCKSASSVLQSIRSRRSQRLAAKIQRVLLPRFESVTQAVEVLSESEAILRDSAEADAIVIVSYDLDAEDDIRSVRQALSFGVSVDHDAVVAATHELCDANAADLIPNTASIHKDCPQAYAKHQKAIDDSKMCGIAVIRLVLCDIVLVRLGVRQNIRWAGAQAASTGKELTTSSRLQPRGSFQAFDEKLSNVSFDWSDTQLDALSSFRAHAHVSFCDVLAADERRRTNKLTKRFLASVSHELRTPFNGIVGLLSALSEEQGMPASAKDLVGTAGRSADAMLGILDDLLTAAKLDERKVELLANPIDVPLIVNSVYLLFERTVSAESLRLVEKVSSHISMEKKGLLGDPGRIRQILLNLVGNALKFSHKSDGSIRKGQTINLESAIFSDRDALHAEVMKTLNKYQGVSQPREDVLHSILNCSHPLLKETPTGENEDGQVVATGTKVEDEEAKNAGGTIPLERSSSGKSVLESQEVLEISEDSICARSSNKSASSLMTVNSGEVEPEVVYALFTVTDEGIGMEESAMRSKLFQKFSQVHSVGIRKKYQGTGLGLSICFDLAILMGGNIWACSSPDNGTAFQFFVPLQMVPAKEAPVVSSVEEEETSTFRMLCKPCTLQPTQDVEENKFVTDSEEDEFDLFIRDALATQKPVMVAADDNNVNRLVLGRSFKNAFPGNPNMCCDGGLPLVALVRKLVLASCPVAAVVIDFHMPDCDGLTAATEILKIDPKIKIWLYTADTSPDLQDQATGLGLRGVIVKPSTLKTFKSTLLS